MSELCDGMVAGRPLASGRSRAQARGARWPSVLLAAAAVGSALLPATAAEPARFSPSAGRPLQVATKVGPAGGLKVDHAVVPAGGLPPQSRCGHGPRVPCPRCMPAEGHGPVPGQGAFSNGGGSMPCAVRPDVFGFYGTSWRRWPGTGVTPVANEEAATPARPPRIEVPAVDEESPPAEAAGPAAAAADLP